MIISTWQKTRDSYNSYCTRHDWDVHSEEEFYNLRDEASLVADSPVAKWFLIISPFFLTVVGLLLWEIYMNHSLTTVIWFIVLFGQLAMFSIGGYWFDSGYWDMITDTATGFEEPHKQYYEEVGKISERIFEGIHLVGEEAERRFHYPTGIMLLIGIIIVLHSSAISIITGVDPLTIPWLYFLVVSVYLLFFAIQAFWTLLVALYFLSYRIPRTLLDNDNFNPQIDILSYNSRLGFDSFFSFLATGVTISTLNLIVLVAVFTLLNVPLYISTTILSIQSLVSIVPFFAFQYGLHLLIIREKEKLLNNLRDTYDGNFDIWLNKEISNWDGDSMDAYLFLEFKREIERAPEWPSNIILGIQIIATALVPPVLNFIISYLI